MEVDVPAHGRAAPVVTLMRSGAARGTRHGILVVAATIDGALERTTVATGVVEIAPTPAWMPSLDTPLFVLALVLLAAAAAIEVRRARGRGLC